jgi:predicted oxidoreductase
MFRPHALSLFLVLCVVVPQWARGSVPGVTASQVQGITDSTRAKVLAYLARGELAEAVQAYEVATGLKAPLWLAGSKAAFEASKQAPGMCQSVARSIHAAFTQLGGKPEYVRLMTVMDETGRRAGFMVFQMADGRDLRMSERGFHIVVRMKDRIYDAFTVLVGSPGRST